jgi:hypothetical protein
VSSSVTIRYADTDAVQDEARAIFTLLVQMHLEGVGIPEHLAPLDHDKALGAIANVVRHGLTVMAYDGAELVGVLGLIRCGVWYSQAPMLSERFFYIQSEHRHGSAMRAMLRAARDCASANGLFLQLTIANFHKDRPARNGLERIGETLSFFPRGSTYTVAPAEKAPA